MTRSIQASSKMTQPALNDGTARDQRLERMLPGVHMRLRVWENEGRARSWWREERWRRPEVELEEPVAEGSYRQPVSWSMACCASCRRRWDCCAV